MLSILVTGSNGQLGQEIKQLSYDNENQFIFTDINELDITNEKEIELFFAQNKINIIVNCAAYTAVDKAESEPEKAELINSTAVKYLKNIAQANNCYFIHISTDYVFDGLSHKPYIEKDMPNPNSVYGNSKLNGEKHLEIMNKAIIIRTSWLYSVFGNNIVKTVLKYGKEREELKFITDQVGSPTNAADLAYTILQIIGHTINDKRNFIPGIYHYSNEGVCSWYDFAKEIVEIAKIDCKVAPIETKDYFTPAARPYYSVLNKTKIKKTYNLKIPHWKDSLIKCLNTLQES